METQTLRILAGDCRTILPTLEPGSVQCCVTSPPYWGLRDYGVDGQLGLEATPEEYIQKMVAVFREVWRVLRDDGTLWLNIGDSYAGSMGGSVKSDEAWDNYQAKAKDQGFTPGMRARTPYQRNRCEVAGLKPKDLCGIPWRLAFALQADGWYLRSDIIWHKPNPMPESVADRPTKSHEYIFLLSKQERYFYDAEAIREPSIDPESINGIRKRHSCSITNDEIYVNDQGRTRGGFLKLDGQKYEMRNKRTVWTIPTQPYAEAHFATFPEEIPKLCILAGSKPGDIILDPFAGSGTVGKVAIELGRRAVLIELSAAYVELARERTNVTPGLFCNGALHRQPEGGFRLSEEDTDQWGYPITQPVRNPDNEADDYDLFGYRI